MELQTILAVGTVVAIAALALALRYLSRAKRRHHALNEVLLAEAAVAPNLSARVCELLEVRGGIDLNRIWRQRIEHHKDPHRANRAFLRIVEEIVRQEELAAQAKLVAGGRVAILRLPVHAPGGAARVKRLLRSRGARAILTVDGGDLWAERSPSETSPIDGRFVHALIHEFGEELGESQTDWIVDPWRASLNWLPRRRPFSKLKPDNLAWAVALDLRPLALELPARALRRVRGGYGRARRAIASPPEITER